jgi:hypothetical protein
MNSLFDGNWHSIYTQVYVIKNNYPLFPCIARGLYKKKSKFYWKNESKGYTKDYTIHNPNKLISSSISVSLSESQTVSIEV